MSTRRPWSDAEKQELLDRLRAGERYRDVARALGREEGACRHVAKALRLWGWTASEAQRRARGVAARPARRCLACGVSFTPPSRYRFRCDLCLKAAEGIAA